MSLELRALLFIGAITTMVYFFWQIRKNRLQIGYAVSWSALSITLVVLAIFPGIVTWAAELIGVISPTNLLYLVVLFAVIVKLFSVTIKLSKLDSQIAELTQKLALDETCKVQCSEKKKGN